MWPVIQRLAGAWAGVPSRVRGTSCGVRAGMLLISAVRGSAAGSLHAGAGRTPRPGRSLPAAPPHAGHDERVERATANRSGCESPKITGTEADQIEQPKPVSPCLRPGSGSFARRSRRPLSGGQERAFVSLPGSGARYGIASDTGRASPTLWTPRSVGARGWTDKGARCPASLVAGPATSWSSSPPPPRPRRSVPATACTPEAKSSCRGGKEVVINLDRWLKADPDPAWRGHLSTYRDLVVQP